MTKKSPLQIVEEQHGSKAELAKKVYELLEKPEDDEDAHALEYRVQTMSNRKLLRLWNAHQLMGDQFGSKEDLVDAVEEARYPKGNDEYRAKLKGFTVPKLLDVARREKLVSASELGWRS